MTTWTGTRREPHRLISEIEIWTTAHAEMVAALVRAGDDACEAMQQLYDQMDRLAGLRRERAIIERLAQIKPGSVPEPSSVGCEP